MTPYSQARLRLWLARGLRWVPALGLFPPLAAYLALQAGFDVLGPVRVRGYAVPRGRAGVTAVREYGEHWPEGQLAIHAGPYLAHFTRAALGASMPTREVCIRLGRLGRSGWPGADLADLWTSRHGGLDVPLLAHIDRSTLSERLSQLRQKLERLPVPGMRMQDGSLLAGIPGFTIDFSQAVDAVTQALQDDANDVRIPARNVPPPAPVSYDDAQAARFPVEMMSFETKYKAWLSGRAHNIALAVERLDGVVIAPGGELSFNQQVGERSYARGFATAKEIAARRIVDGVGGGVCQVAATLHAAAFLAGFTLLEYRPHSRPAHYIELGLDTMVSWPAQDMRIANPYPFPVRVRAQADDGVVRVTLEGSGKPYVVDWSTTVVSRVRAGSEQVVDDALAPGEREELQEAIDGVTVRRVRTVYLPSGPRREDDLLTYPPNNRIIAVGPGNLRSGLSPMAAVKRSRLELEDF